VFGMALESKGFGARDDRTFYLTMEFEKRDYTTLSFSIAVVIFCLYINFLDYGNIAGLTKF